jgi:magnesium transporter
MSTEAEKKYLLEELQIPEAFYNDIEDIDERPRIEIENGWTLIICEFGEKQRCKLPFIPFLLGLCLKVKFALPFSSNRNAYRFCDLYQSEKHKYQR